MPIFRCLVLSFFRPCSFHRQTSRAVLPCLALLFLCVAGGASIPAYGQSVAGTVTVGSNPQAAAVNTVTDQIYVTNFFSNTVTVIDGATHATSTVNVGTHPGAAAVNPVTNKVYVANSGGGTVTVIDGATNATSTVNVGQNPDALVVNPVTDKVYVANAGSNTVTVIDGATNATSTVNVGSNPDALAVDPVTNKVYVADNASASATVIDGATNATSTVNVGSGPFAVAVNPVTNKVYVANSGSNTVTVIDGATNATSTVNAGSGPQAIAVNPVTDKVYVANFGNPLGNSTVTVIDGATNATSTVAVGTMPLAVAVNPVTDKVYVANSASNNVSVIDGATDKVTSTVNVGSGPGAVAFNPITDKAYVANSGGTTVTVIDGATNATSTVNVGSLPYAAAVNPVTDKVYVANYNSTNVTAIDGATNATSTIHAGSLPAAVAVNPVTDQVYVANQGSNTVTVIDGATNTTSTVNVGSYPYAVAVNPVTDQVYVANYSSDTVTVINGATNATSTVHVGSFPVAVAVNPVTDQVYVTNFGSTNVTEIDGATNATSTVNVESGPDAVAVNSVTDKVYVANYTSDTVTEIDGATNATSTITVGTHPDAVAVNSVTDKVYVANYTSDTVTEIDGATNATSTITVGANPGAVAVNPVTDQVYVANRVSNTVTVINGATNATSTVNVGTGPDAVAVNPVTDQVYVANQGSPSSIGNTVTAIDAEGIQPVPITTKAAGVSDSLTTSTANNVFQTMNSKPSFTVKATSAYSTSSAYSGVTATNPPPTMLYYSVDGGPWSETPTTSTSGSNPASFTVALSQQSLGFHTLYYYVGYGNEGGQNSSLQGTGNSPEISNVKAYHFLVEPISTTTSVVADANPQNVGSSVTFTATVKPVTTSSTLTGSVQFYDGTTALGSPVTVQSSGSVYQAVYSTSSLAEGTHTIKAVYSGDTNYAGSSGSMTEQMAGVAASIATSSGGGQSAPVGTAFTNPVVVTVKDSSGIPVPGATVNFSGTGLSYSPATASTNSSGQASTTAKPTQGGALTGTATVGSYNTTFSETGTKLTPTVTVQSGSTVYGTTTTKLKATIAYTGSTAPTGAVTFTVNSGSTVTGTCNGTSSPLTCTASYPTASLPVSGGPYTVVASLAADSDYQAATGTGTGALTITQAQPVVQWTAPASIAYGTALGGTQLDATASYNGSPVAGTFTYTPAAGTVLSAGTHSLSVSFTPTDTTDYTTPAAVTTSLTVSQATPIIQWTAPASIAYGTALGGTELDATASYNGSPVAGAFTYTPAAGTVLPAGTHTLSVSFTPTDSTDYTTPTAVTTSLTVTKATPNIQWTAPASIAYGTALGGTQLDATASYNGSPVAGTFSYTPAAGTVLSAGTHSLSVSFTPTDTTDYTTPAAVTTSLMVTKPTLAVVASNASRVYGTANPAFTGKVSGAVNGDTFTESFSTTATTTSNAGTYPIVPSVAGTALSDYTVSVTNGTLTVTKAGSTVSLTSSTKNANLNADVTFTAMVTSATTGTPTGSVEFMNGTTVLGTSPLNGTATATYTTNKLTAGLHQITAVYSGDGNFDGSTSAPLAQIMTAPGFSLMSSVRSLSLKAGQTGHVTISFIPVGGFTGTVQFTCSGLQTESRCAFSPASLTADGSNKTQTSTMTITTTGPNSGTVAMMQSGKPDEVLMAGMFWLPSLLFGLFLFWQRKRLTAKYRVLLVLLLVATTMSGMVGCGFSQPYTGPGTKMVTVTASNGTTTHTATIEVKITQ